MNMLELLFQKQNLTEQKVLAVVALDIDSLEKCKECIDANSYIDTYDVSLDGVLNQTDYNALYNMFYGKYNDYKKANSNETSLDVRDIVRMKRNIAGKTNIEHNNLDLDNDGSTTGTDITILSRWLLYGKTNPATFT